MKKNLIVNAVCALALMGCDGQDHAKDSRHGPAASTDGEPVVEKITHFAAWTEVFVEFPRLVVGEKSAFAAHVTRLSDFKALDAGTVRVVLSGTTGTDEAFSTDAPAQPGIFRPVAEPRQAGARKLAIEITTPRFTERHELGEVEVYTNRQAANAAPTKTEGSGIAFAKEQQWNVDFATVEISTRAIRTSLSATGALRGKPDSEALVTAPAAGRIQPSRSFPFLGQNVTQGTVLAYFAPRLGGDTDMASLEAETRKAKVEFDHAVRERVRLEGLFKDEAVPEKRVFHARAAEESARAVLDAAGGRLAQYGANAGGIALRAPVSGTIADVRIAPGGFAQEGALLFYILDRRRLWLELRVPEGEAARLVAPSGATFRVEGIEHSMVIVSGKNGRLIATGGAVDPATRTVPVLFEVFQPDERLRVGMAVKAQIHIGGVRNAMVVPSSSVIDENGVPYVFTMKNSESFEKISVRLGARDGDWVEVIEGTSLRQRVVSKGAWLVKLAATSSAKVGHGHAH